MGVTLITSAEEFVRIKSTSGNRLVSGCVAFSRRPACRRS
mgnify:CR=1 FL=1